ncbi:hypothetical protein FB45DRAFT_1056605 [Roridomyces roridus]|uniref:F-box domain-containing protein n=1 Tax=Roridomyces roridus TaxID=1738132 RepID=A0AAD7FRQ7_9AGAR|nr:hypothetical protein FB45DRAFT_1056605 [Roridomyces roridus]
MRSPFASWLGTNYCPTVGETAELKAFLAEPLLQMKCLENKITGMRQALNKLLEEREELQTYLHAHTALFSPIRRMPADVMQEIFLACLPTHRNCVMDVSEAPLLLGRICSAWRTLSLATPRLWSSLHIVDRGKLPEESEPAPAVSESEPDYPPDPWLVAEERRAALVADAVRAWLERSRQCPLSISLHYDLQSLFGLPPSQSIIHTIFSLAYRWQHIRFSASVSVFRKLEQLSAADVPQLKSVGLQYHEASSEWASPGFAQWDNLSFLSGPKVAAFAAFGEGLASPQLPVEWSRLAALSNVSFPDENPTWMREPSRLRIDAGLLIMSRCSQLRSLSFVLKDHFSNIPRVGELPFVDLHLLQTLHLSGDGTPSSILLDKINVPQLKNLTLRTDWMTEDDRVWWGNHHTNRDSFSEPSLVRFLATLPLLESLSLTTRKLGPSSVKEILLHLPPSLLHLHITSDKSFSRWDTPDWKGDFLAPLVTPESTIPLPILRDFDIVVAREELITDKTLLQFITARASTLKRVKLDFERPMDFDIVHDAALSSFIENGLDFAVTYGPPTFQVPEYSPWTGLPDTPEPVLLTL